MGLRTSYWRAKLAKMSLTERVLREFRTLERSPHVLRPGLRQRPPLCVLRGEGVLLLPRTRYT